MKVLSLIESEIVAVDSKTAAVIQLEQVLEHGIVLYAISVNGNVVCTFHEVRFAKTRYMETVAKLLKRRVVA